MSMDTLNIVIAGFFLFSLLLIIAGIIVCVFLPKQMGGKIKLGKKEVSSLRVGLPLIFIGIAIFLSVLEPAYDRELREKYLDKARYYLWADKRYIISGGVNKTDRIVVDDDLRIRLNDNQMVLNDIDKIRSDYDWAKYRGEPVIFFTDDLKWISVAARDVKCCTYYLSPLYLHRPDGTVMKLTDGVKEKRYEHPPDKIRLFFKEVFEIVQ